ncbi:CvpA family protein [Roseomonas sp. BN140053]|uniref:CvpA family protein n=1 Tax=Roseomonas sp. BN140053 TaxID=3391898 RepID=UPI0039EC4FBB
MTWVDGVLLLVLAVSALIAYSRGLVREVLGVGAWVGALFFAFLLLPGMRSALATAVQPDWLRDVVAVGGVFVVALIVLKLVISAVARRVQNSVLGGVDRALGTVFGLARGAFLAVVAYIVGGLFLPSADRWPEPVRDARALPLVADGARWLAASLPPDYRPRVPDAPNRPLPPMEDLLRPPPRSRT